MKPIKGMEITPFLNICWTSEKNKKAWKFAIESLHSQALDLEIKTLVTGQRRCAWRSVHENALPDLVGEMLKLGLIVMPIRYTGIWSGFAHSSPALIPGQPKNVYCIITPKKEDGFNFKKAFEKSDIPAQGYFLGYPKCCREAFAKNYQAGIVDPIFQAAERTIKNNIGKQINGDFATKNKINLESLGHPLSNPMLRYIGLRVSFHIPCSFNCKDTIKNAEAATSLMHPASAKLLKYLLSLPMEWSVNHGIGILKTQFFYVIFNSISTRRKWMVRLKWSKNETR